MVDGKKDVQQGTLALGANYTVTFAAANLAITPKITPLMTIRWELTA